ncbi:MAG: hypothetical protein KDA25_04485 [Phycisphaerales bacterium]|nr:hypothetical protein [Phycisphaerales bacterium]
MRPILRSLAVATAVAALTHPVVGAPALEPVRVSLLSVRDAIAVHGTPARTVTVGPIDRLLADVDRVAALLTIGDVRALEPRFIASVGGDGLCAFPAELYLSTGAVLVNDDGGTQVITLSGTSGAMTFQVLSGTSQGAIVAAFNLFRDMTGISATVNDVDDARISLTSIESPPSAFVSVDTENSVGGPLIFTSATEWTGAFAATDFAQAATPGDLDCNGAVNPTDLGMMLASWGSCPGCAADLTFNGIVDGDDLATLLANWGGDPE